MVQRKDNNLTKYYPKYPAMPMNCSITARNLRKCDLGGVIFGCKHNTMNECLTKQMFGLPYTHYSYVRNIQEGLPLFLFNYSDRKMHGLFEAAGPGRLNADSYAWTDGGQERTPFPAQVAIRIRVRCQPVMENQFKRVIEENYYTPQHFWFELDHVQTRGLTALFTPLPSPTKTMITPFRSQRNGASKASTSSNWRVLGSSEAPNANGGEAQKDPKTTLDMLNDILSEINLDSTSWNEGKNAQEGSSSQTPPAASNEADCEVPEHWEDLAENNAISVADYGFSVEEQQTHHQFETEMERVLSKLQRLVDERQIPDSSQSDCKDNRAVQYYTREVTENYDEVPNENYSDDFANEGGVSWELAEACENDILEDKSNVILSMQGDIPSSSRGPRGNLQFERIIKDLKERAENLEKNQVICGQEIERLAVVFNESEVEIEQLKGQIKELELAIDESMRVDDSMNQFVEHCLGSEDVIYLIGGFNGSSLLSNLDSYSPAMDIITPLKAMLYPKSYASAVALSRKIYVIGGGDGLSWNKTVECYDPVYDEWKLYPSLVDEKGSLASVTLRGKIYALGGGNGNDCFAKVEMFDPALERWIMIPSMLQKRFSLDSAELNGAIYAVGGFDGNKYLRSVERLDPREPHWKMLAPMNATRGCHSVAVLNEKLYSTGGYDTDEMVPTVEVYDPRMSVWVMAEPMHFSRGYASTAVLGGSIYAIGGVDNCDNILDIVECYKEGRGWVKTDLKGIGKRCYSSVVVI
ncbi:Kelch-like protein 12 [Ananas comosus]|uniref:Kelch-like protein 12 n=1 Tax=Ananas comosus TaxID=4615 RepID=A0A199UCH3_ANACO|nr:Kelch-like protein 12 [Ananas comosus]